jgi:hypothetical protein
MNVRGKASLKKRSSTSVSPIIELIIKLILLLLVQPLAKLSKILIKKAFCIKGKTPLKDLVIIKELYGKSKPM